MGRVWEYGEGEYACDNPPFLMGGDFACFGMIAQVVAKGVLRLAEFNLFR